MLLKNDSFFSTDEILFQSAIMAATLVMAIIPATAIAIQDEAAETTTEIANEGLDSLLGQWRDLESELIRLEKAFNESTDSAQQDDLRGQYTSLVGEANELVARIKTEAIAAFKSDPSDQQTARLLVGILKNDAEFDRIDDAIKLGDDLIAGGVDGSLFETAAQSDQISITTREVLEELFIRSNQHKLDTLPQVKIETSKGDIVVELFEDEAPNTVANFISLVEDNFYDGLKFHRVIEGFVAQGGDPQGDGSGGPGYSIACECNNVEARRHYIGSLSMAHAGKDTGGSQFFLCLTQTPSLNELHTVFGRVISGMDVLDRLSRNYTPTGPIPNAETDVIRKMEVLRKRDHEYKPVKIGDEIPEEKVDPPPAQPETLDKATDNSREQDEDETGDQDSGTPDPSGDQTTPTEPSEESESPSEPAGSESSEGGGGGNDDGSSP